MSDRLDHWRNGGWNRLDADLVVETDNRSAAHIADEISDSLLLT